MSDWNIAKWDWEILDMLTSKATQIPPHNQYPIILEGYCDIIHQNTSFNSSMPSSSAADFGNNACISTKTSISASTASTSNGTPPMLNASLGFNESLACLKLGKPTYSDNTTTSNIIAYNNNTISSSSSEIPLLLSTDTKKRKSYCQSTSPPNPLCQVEGCSLDLSSAKAYHRKHRVCETHSKSSKVVIRGLERRFCQQCSRFHNLSEFDQKKRSCRRRLSDHNARRRKPYHETIQFNSTRQYCSSSFYYDERQEMSFMLSSNTRVSQITSAWESRCGSNYALITRGRGYIVKPAAHDHKTTLPDPHSHLPTAIDQLPRVIINHETNHLFPYTTDSICQAAAADDVDRALSLLSTNTWGTYVGPHII